MTALGIIAIVAATLGVDTLIDVRHDIVKRTRTRRENRERAAVASREAQEAAVFAEREQESKRLALKIRNLRRLLEDRSLYADQRIQFSQALHATRLQALAWGVLTEDEIDGAEPRPIVSRGRMD